MYVKRLIAGVAACLMAVSAFSMSASANSALENMKATIYGGATVSSASAEKTAVGKFFFTARANTSDGWNTSGNEWVYFRGRSAKNNAQATKLVHRNYYGEQVRDYMGYLSGYRSRLKRGRYTALWGATVPAKRCFLSASAV